MAELKSKKVSVVQISDKEQEIHHIDVDRDFGIDKGPRFGCRHGQTVLMSLAFICGLATRTNMSTAIVAMTDKTASSNPNIPTYDWNNTSIILSSFFWSYITFQVLAGYLGKTYGPKYFLLTAFLINCTCCALVPLAAEQSGSNGVIICRVFQGLSQGFLYPSINVLLGTWAPEEERTTLNNIAYTGVALGQIIASLITGYVAASSWGWPASFYILSAMGVCWCIVWFFFGQNSPATHPRISIEEKQYIQTSLQQEDGVNLPVPWKKIFMCRPFYALVVSSIGYSWGYSILLTETPTYLAHVMNFKLESNATLNSLLIASMLLCSLVTGPLADWIISRQILTRRNQRRIFTVIGTFGQALCLIWLGFLRSSQSTLSIVVLAIGNSLSTFVLVGCNVNHLDLSPRFSGIIFGFTNAAGMGVSIIGPLTANWIVSDLASGAQWQIVFLIAAVFLFVGGTVFFFFGSAERQPWDGPEDKRLEERKKKISVVSFMST